MQAGGLHKVMNPGRQGTCGAIFMTAYCIPTEGLLHTGVTAIIAAAHTDPCPSTYYIAAFGILSKAFPGL